MLLSMPDIPIVMLALLLLCFFVFICAMYLLAECTTYVTLLAQTQAPSLWASELPLAHIYSHDMSYVHLDAEPYETKGALAQLFTTYVLTTLPS